MLCCTSNGEDEDGQLWAQVPCQSDAASVFGAVGLKVGVGIDDPLSPSGYVAQQSEGAGTRGTSC
eukprot:1780078-Prymnesium_polylepis.3